MKDVKVTDEMILREIAGEYILIPVGKMALKLHGMINLSESAVLLWKKLQTHCTEEELVEVLLQEYEVDRETAGNDVREFIEAMKEIGILQTEE